MTIKQIECFLAVAKTLSFTQASEELFMSQPTVSRHIRHLEDYLGLTLFFRNTNTVHLTPAGLLMVQTFTETLDFITNQVETAKKMALGESGVLHLGFLHKTDVITHFSTPFNTFNQLYPNIELHYHFYNYEELESKLKSKELDAVFTPNFTSFNPDEFASEPVYQTKAFLLYSINHPLADKENLTFLDFKNDTFYSALPKELAHKYWERVFSHFGISVWKTNCTQSFDAGLLKVFMGEGVTILDPVSSSLDFTQYKKLALPDEISDVKVSISWLRNNFNTSLPLLLNILLDLDYGVKLLKSQQISDPSLS